MTLYPLKFHEIYKPKIWGGRKIESVIGKPLPEGECIGESWEICDHFDDVSVVRNGVLEGKRLRDVWQAQPEAVLGKEIAARGPRFFPLLIKFIDAEEDLSVQVHPDDEYAAKCDPNGDGGKNEAWYILQTDPGARLVSGLKAGTSREEFKRLVAEGRVEDCLHWTDVAPGDVIHVAAGTVHAVSKGILLCEIQQTSDATYRIYDYGRPGDNGKPRPLHLKEAMDVIDFGRGPVGKAPAQELSPPPERRQLLDTCPYFVIEKIEGAARWNEVQPQDRFHILICIGGEGSLVAGGERYPYRTGDTVLVPAAVRSIAVDPVRATTFLKAWVP